MAIDAWLPKQTVLASGIVLNGAIDDGANWQIYETQMGNRVLVTTLELGDKWHASNLLELGLLNSFKFGTQSFYFLHSESRFILNQVGNSPSPTSKNEALGFAEAMRLTRQKDLLSPLHDALYVEKITRLLPTYSISTPVSDDIVLGYWLTGGVPISVSEGRRFTSLTSWLGRENVADIVQKSGVIATPTKQQENVASTDNSKLFALHGRPDLEAFLREHVIDIIENKEKYAALGIDFPSALILHGPPGCGKTFAIERLVEHLGWPNYQIEASSVASPYIHETSKKIAAVFDKAIDNSPSIIVIDEMEAFLSERQSDTGPHKIEEVAEFLRRIPEAGKQGVLVVGMTNKLEMIDPAILRRGRFDHVIKVDMASSAEIHSLLQSLLAKLPTSSDINLEELSEILGGRPLSDVAFIVREGARLTARAGKEAIDHDSLKAALLSSPSRSEESEPRQKIGFI